MTSDQTTQREFTTILNDEQKAIDLLERIREVGMAKDRLARDLLSLARSLLLCGTSAESVMDMLSNDEPLLVMRSAYLLSRFSVPG